MIQATMICDSIDPRGNRLRTLEVIMPRYILAEFNTHRMLSKNSASSRAIPISKMLNSVRHNGFKPYAWQKSHSGMQGNEYHTDPEKIEQIEAFWDNAKEEALTYCSLLDDEDVTKQIANRLLEPFMYHKVLVSGTEWDNFFNLRCPQYEDLYENEIYKSRKDMCDDWDRKHLSGLPKQDLMLDWLKINKGQADIHMMFLAEAIWDATNESTPRKLKEGEWHIPYYELMTPKEENQTNDWINNYTTKSFKNNLPTLQEFTDKALELRRKISVARCARLSYQTLGDNPEINYEKDLELYEVLAKSGHYSPFEHVARVMTWKEYSTFHKGQILFDSKTDGIVLTSPQDDNRGWCLNFKGFIQERYLLEQSWKG